MKVGGIVINLTSIHPELTEAYHMAYFFSKTNPYPAIMLSLNFQILL